MDLRQLEMFIAVVENLSFTRASHQLHVAESAISRKISMLEDELGEQLFKRVNKSIYLTPSGKTLLAHARHVFHDLRDVSLEISAIGQLARGYLRIGSILTASVYLLPPILQKFKELYPNIEIKLVTGTTRDLALRLCDDAVDIGIMTMPVRFPTLQTVPLCREELVIVCSPNHPSLGKKTSIPLQDLASLRFILPPEETYTRILLEKFCRKGGIKPIIGITVDNALSIKPLVKSNLGVTVLPLPVVIDETKRGELHYLTISQLKLTRQLGVVTQKARNQSKVVAEFIRMFQVCNLLQGKI